MDGFKNEIYAADVINDKPENFKGLEIRGARETGEVIDGKKSVTTDDVNPQFVSVFLRDQEGLAHCIADFGTHAEAVAYGRPLADNYGWAFEDQIAGVKPGGLTAA